MITNYKIKLITEQIGDSIERYFIICTESKVPKWIRKFFRFNNYIPFKCYHCITNNTYCLNNEWYDSGNEFVYDIVKFKSVDSIKRFINFYNNREYVEYRGYKLIPIWSSYDDSVKFYSKDFFISNIFNDEYKSGSLTEVKVYIDKIIKNRTKIRTEEFIK